MVEDFRAAKEKAKQYLDNADHILSITYPLVKEPKLLVAAMDNIYLSLLHTINASLHFERAMKRIPPFHDSFENKVEIFKRDFIKKYNLKSDYIKLIMQINNLLENHKKSTMEFPRKDVFVICTNDYSIKTLSMDEMKKIVAETKNFLRDVDAIIK